jgi:hypothetical protein
MYERARQTLQVATGNNQSRITQDAFNDGWKSLLEFMTRPPTMLARKRDTYEVFYWTGDNVVELHAFMRGTLLPKHFPPMQWITRRSSTDEINYWSSDEFNHVFELIAELKPLEEDDASASKPRSVGEGTH